MQEERGDGLNMTNEKAIDLLRRMQDPEAYEPQITEEAFEALEMAIMALATDTNVGTELSTNLAEVGTDCISRQAAIDAARDWYEGLICGSFKGLEKRLRSLPPAQPDIIRCRNCKFASGDSRICMKFGHSPIGELDFCAWAERRTDG